MSIPDLTTAIDEMEIYISANGGCCSIDVDLLSAALHDALPHILNAYAGLAAQEACFPKSYDDAVQKVATGSWLRAKAEEAAN